MINIEEINPYEEFYDEQLNNTMIRINKELSGNNKKEIKEYIKYLKIEEKTSPARIVSLGQTIIRLYNILKIDFSKATKNDAINLVKYIEELNIKERSKTDLKAIYKQYRKWLTGNIDFPEDVRWIKKKVLCDYRKVEEKTPEEIMGVEDYKKFISACDTPRDKALFGMIGELGLRPRESIMLKNRNIDTTNPEYVIVTVPADTKTGSRSVPLIFSKKWILEWKNKYHIDKDNPNAYLFIQERRNRNRPLSYKGLIDRFNRILKQSKISKRYTLYDFRKFSYTHKALKGWSDQQIKAFHGLRPKSKAIDVYVKINCKDLLNPVKELYGLTTKKIHNKEMELIVCPNCSTEQPSSNKQCETCGVYLDISEANKLLEDKKKQENKKENEIELLKKQVADMPSQIMKLLKSDPSVAELQENIKRREKAK